MKALVLTTLAFVFLSIFCSAQGRCGKKTDAACKGKNINDACSSPPNGVCADLLNTDGSCACKLPLNPESSAPATIKSPADVRLGSPKSTVVAGLTACCSGKPDTTPLWDIFDAKDNNNTPWSIVFNNGSVAQIFHSLPLPNPPSAKDVLNAISGDLNAHCPVIGAIPNTLGYSPNTQVTQIFDHNDQTKFGTTLSFRCGTHKIQAQDFLGDTRIDVRVTEAAPSAQGPF